MTCAGAWSGRDGGGGGRHARTRRLAQSGAGRTWASRTPRVRVSDGVEGWRRLRAQAVLRRGHHGYRHPVPRAREAWVERRARARRRAPGGVHHDRSQGRAAAAGTAGGTCGTRGRHVRAAVGLGRRRALRCDDPDAAPSHPSRGRPRRRRGGGGAEPARPDGLRRQSLAPDRAAGGAGKRRGGAEGGGAADRQSDQGAARRWRAGGGHHRHCGRAEPAGVPAPLGTARAGGVAREQLPDRHGQRGPRRADHQDRPGQRPAAARRLRVRGARGGHRGLHGGADRLRVSDLPGRHHAEPAAVAPAARRVPGDAAAVDPRCRPATGR